MSVKHTIRNSVGDHIQVNLSPLKAIRKFCVECMGFQVSEIIKCTAPLCPLFPFRQGKTGREISPEEMKRMQESGKNLFLSRGTSLKEPQNEDISD